MIIAGARRPVDPATRRTPPRAKRAAVPRVPMADTPALPPPGSHRANSSEGAWHAVEVDGRFTLSQALRTRSTRSRQEPDGFPLNGWRRACLPAAHTFLPGHRDHKGLPHRRPRLPRRAGRTPRHAVAAGRRGRCALTAPRARRTLLDHVRGARSDRHGRGTDGMTDPDRRADL